MRKFFGGFFFVLSLILISSSQASAAKGFYLGGNLLFASIDGDFDGTNGPEADPGAGIGLIIGYGFTDAFALQFDWNVSVHDAQVISIAPEGDAGHGAFIIGLKGNFMTHQPLQPYIHAGFGGFSFIIDDPLIGDVELTGTGFDLGFGADYYINPNVSFGFGLSRRFVSYDELEIGGTKGSLSPEVDGDATIFDFNFIYHFGEGWTGNEEYF